MTGKIARLPPAIQEQLNQQQHLAIELGDNAQAKEKEFWEWTRPPDIQAKLYPKHDPDKIRRAVVRLLDRELLGVVSDDMPDEAADPASLI